MAKEKRLIDAEKLKDAFRGIYTGADIISNEPKRLTLQTLLYFVDVTPTEEAPISAERAKQLTEAYIKGYNAGAEMAVHIINTYGNKEEEPEK